MNEGMETFMVEVSFKATVVFHWPLSQNCLKLQWLRVLVILATLNPDIVIRV